MAKYCEHCGAELNEVDKFCGVCGKATPSTVLEQQPLPHPTAVPQKSNKHLVSALIGVVGGLAVVVVAGVIWMTSHTSPPQDDAPAVDAPPVAEATAPAPVPPPAVEVVPVPEPAPQTQTVVKIVPVPVPQPQPETVYEYEDNFDSYSSDYLLPSNYSYISEQDLSLYTKRDVMLARNEIYARYGYSFNDKDIAAYFNSKYWYAENPSINAQTFGLSNLNKYERANIDTIVAYEKKMGWKK